MKTRKPSNPKIFNDAVADRVLKELRREYRAGEISGGHYRETLAHLVDTLLGDFRGDPAAQGELAARQDAARDK